MSAETIQTQGHDLAFADKKLDIVMNENPSSPNSQEAVYNGNSTGYAIGHALTSAVVNMERAGYVPDDVEIHSDVQDPGYRESHTVEFGAGLKSTYEYDAPHRFAGIGVGNEGVRATGKQEVFVPMFQRIAGELKGKVNAAQLEVLGKASDLIAGALHEDWRSNWHAEDAKKDQPEGKREKKTTDSEWVEAHGTDVVDIANTPFESLPADWQAENKAAANVIVGILVNEGTDIDLQDPDVRKRLGEQIHDAWLSRNEWAKDGELGKPFAELSAEEQAKDLAQLEIGLATFK